CIDTCPLYLFYPAPGHSFAGTSPCNQNDRLKNVPPHFFQYSNTPSQASFCCFSLFSLADSQQLSFSVDLTSSISILQQSGLENNFLNPDFFSVMNVTPFKG